MIAVFEVEVELNDDDVTFTNFAAVVARLKAGVEQLSFVHNATASGTLDVTTGPFENQK